LSKKLVKTDLTDSRVGKQARAQPPFPEKLTTIMDMLRVRSVSVSGKSIKSCWSTSGHVGGVEQVTTNSVIANIKRLFYMEASNGRYTKN
jgi:hypothetical protein